MDLILTMQLQTNVLQNSEKVQLHTSFSMCRESRTLTAPNISFLTEKGLQYDHQILQLLCWINWRVTVTVTVPGQCHALTCLIILTN
jgi:hypothetical protein